MRQAYHATRKNSPELKAPGCLVSSSLIANHHWHKQHQYILVGIIVDVGKNK